MKQMLRGTLVCDQCGTRHTLSTRVFPMTAGASALALQQQRQEARSQGWALSLDGDQCPDCAAGVLY